MAKRGGGKANLNSRYTNDGLRSKAAKGAHAAQAASTRSASKNKPTRYSKTHAGGVSAGMAKTPKGKRSNRLRKIRGSKTQRAKNP